MLRGSVVIRPRVCSERDGKNITKSSGCFADQSLLIAVIRLENVAERVALILALMRLFILSYIYIFLFIFFI